MLTSFNIFVLPEEFTSFLDVEISHPSSDFEGKVYIETLNLVENVSIEKDLDFWSASFYPEDFGLNTFYNTYFQIRIEAYYPDLEKTEIYIGRTGSGNGYLNCFYKKVLNLEFDGCEMKVNECCEGEPEKVLYIDTVIESIKTLFNKFDFTEDIKDLFSVLNDLCDNCNNCPKLIPSELEDWIGYNYKTYLGKIEEIPQIDIFN